MDKNIQKWYFTATFVVVILFVYMMDNPLSGQVRDMSCSDTHGVVTVSK